MTRLARTVWRYGGEFAASLALAWRIFVRTIGAKYRKSYLGYFWMVAPALLITGGAALANDAGVLTSGKLPLPYTLFVLFGTLLWQVFAEAIEVPHQAFESARSYLTRVQFPREAIVFAQLFEALITTAVRLLLALSVLAVQQGVDLRALLLVTLCFVGAVLLGVGIGAVLMPFTILFVDLHNTIKLALGYGLFLTPAIWQPEGDGVFATVVRLNPISPLMQAAREAAAGLALGQPITVTIVLVVAVAATVGGLLLVRAVSPIVVERMLLGGR